MVKDHGTTESPVLWSRILASQVQCRPWPLALKKPIAPSRPMAPSKSNQTSDPVFAITIDWSIIASDTNVKCLLYIRGSVEQDKYEAVVKNNLE